MHLFEDVTRNRNRNILEIKSQFKIWFMDTGSGCNSLILLLVIEVSVKRTRYGFDFLAKYKMDGWN